MYCIKVRRRRHNGEPWQLLGETATDLAKPVRLTDAEAAESDLLSVQCYAPLGTAPTVRVYVGSVLAASSLPGDRTVLIEYDESGDAETAPLACRGKFLIDWVGLTELVVQVRPADSTDWQVALILPLAVAAGKLAAEQFRRLFAELERDAAAVLLDIHGKTQVGLKSASALAPSAPVAVLGRLRETVRELGALLQPLSRHPAFRLRARSTREQALIGQAVSEVTLAEACRDPSLLGKRGRGLVFREHLREHSHPDYRIPEHRVIADFGEYLQAQLSDLRQRIDAEVAERTERKRWRNLTREPGQPTWWETEDFPRIEELQRCRQEAARLRGVVDDWQRFAFLPPGECLRQQPRSTPLFRNHPVYRRVFRVIAGHFLTYQATLDTHQLLARARSLPVLYEWWCAVRVIRILSAGLTPLSDDAISRPLVASRLAQEGKRFTIEFAPDKALTFRDRKGTRIRFRYQPEYLACRATPGLRIGALNATALRTPDIALEILPANPATEFPELIIVLDAKYSSATQADKVAEVTLKYAKIGDCQKGRILSRQVWALTPAAPAERFGDGLRRHCTVDNEAFWSGRFEAANPVNGAVQARPLAPGEYDPLPALIGLLMRLAGVDYAESFDAQSQLGERGA